MTVLASLNDETGMRCVDIRREDDGSISWLECRRDPEDSHGWRFTGVGESGFKNESVARAAAAKTCTWVQA